MSHPGWDFKCVPGGKGGTVRETPTGFFRTALLLRVNPARGSEQGGDGDHTAAHRGDKKRLIGFRVASPKGRGRIIHTERRPVPDSAEANVAKSRCRYSPGLPGVPV